ncbi:MAG: hypothetical protein MPJ50_09130 [Pirellulales bacterium]|nr:hypothetical protein [Pirellulales bacterium]
MAIAALTLLLTTASCGSAQEHKPGIKVGDVAPAIELKDQNGKVITLKALIAEKPTALVFHRSASW